MARRGKARQEINKGMDCKEVKNEKI